MPKLVLGPLLRYVGETQATVWVETDAAARVEVEVSPATGGREAAGGRERPGADLPVEGHHYALVLIDGLEPDRVYTYRVELDGERGLAGAGGRPRRSRLPGEHHPHPARRPPAADRLWVLPGRRPARAAVDAAAQRRPQARQGGRRPVRVRPADARRRPRHLARPRCCCWATRCTPTTTSEKADSSARAAAGRPSRPGAEVADFEEYTQLYGSPGRDPEVRWLLSTVPTAMIFDDHDIIDDWNTSAAWVEHMRATDWWHERIVSGLASYWLYQHLGNLSPADLDDDPAGATVRDAGDATRVLREFACRADANRGTRWSYTPRLRPDPPGGGRLALRAGAGRAAPRDGRRRRGAWMSEQAGGDFDHLLLATSLPFALAPADPRPGGLERGRDRRGAGPPGAPGSGSGSARASTWSTGPPSTTPSTGWGRSSRRSRPAGGGGRPGRWWCCPATSTTPTWPSSPSPAPPTATARPGRPCARRCATPCPPTSGPPTGGPSGARPRP